MTHLAHWDDAPRVRREVGEIATWMTDLGTAAGSVATGIRRWEIDPGRRPTPPHAHGGEEEIFYVLAGGGLLWLDGDVCEVGTGDAIVHRADEEAHTLKAGPDGLDVLAFGMRISTENCYHPHSGRVWTGPTIVAAEGPRRHVRARRRGGPARLGRARAPARERRERRRRRRRPASMSATAVRMRATWASRPGSIRTGLNLGTVCGRAISSNPPHCHSAEEELFVDPRGLGRVHPRRGGARRCAPGT